MTPTTGRLDRKGKAMMRGRPIKPGYVVKADAALEHLSDGEKENYHLDALHDISATHFERDDAGLQIFWREKGDAVLFAFCATDMEEFLLQTGHIFREIQKLRPEDCEGMTLDGIANHVLARAEKAIHEERVDFGE
jgi:hypothetical protein